MWRASGRSAATVAAELGIRPPLLYRWARTVDVNLTAHARLIRAALPHLTASGAGRVSRRSTERLQFKATRYTHPPGFSS